jgi:hypothetical protein
VSLQLAWRDSEGMRRGTGLGQLRMWILGVLGVGVMEEDVMEEGVRGVGVMAVVVLAVVVAA